MTPLDEIDSFEVELCIAEVMSNVIKHAYQGRSGLPIEVIVSLMPDHVGFEVVDVGREDHFLDRAFRFAENPLQEDALPEGGMGLAIVHQVMSEIQYQREKHENHFKMKKWFFSGWSERARESEVSI